MAAAHLQLGGLLKVRHLVQQWDRGPAVAARFHLTDDITEHACVWIVCILRDHSAHVSRGRLNSLMNCCCSVTKARHTTHMRSICPSSIG